MPPEKTFAFFKYTLYALLAVNIYLFFRHAALHEGLDCIGWMLLLAVFEWETRKGENASPPPVGKVLSIAAQIAAYGLILYAWGNYYLHRQWLDFINASLWLGVVLTIYMDIYWDRREKWRGYWLHHALKGSLYAALAVVAVIWGMQGDILNFYDAFLWIVCFFAIEMNLMQHASYGLLAISRRRARIRRDIS